jgi:Fe-S-cluster-containing dehydrogenase component
MKEESKVFDFDLERCSGCYACVVACLDQNDVDTSRMEGFRDVSIVKPGYSVTKKLGYVSLACMHCDDAPCALCCPTGCLTSDENGLVVSDISLCIGCHSCMIACPYGAPRFGEDGKISKCDGCAVRVEQGLAPACVRVCPTKALKFDTQHTIEQLKKDKLLRRLSSL